MISNKEVEETIISILMENGGDVEKAEESIVKVYRGLDEKHSNEKNGGKVKGQLQKIGFLRSIFHQSLGGFKKVVSKPWRKIFPKNPQDKKGFRKNRKTEEVDSHEIQGKR